MDKLEFDIREATPSDEPAVREFLAGLSPETIRLRYLSGAPVIRSWMVDAVVHADHVLHESLIALKDGRVVGVAEWGRYEPTDTVADVAVVVTDECRRRGIARALLRRLADSARNHGVEAFGSTILSANRPSLALVHNVAPSKTVSFDGPTVDVTIPLHASA